MYWHSLIKYGMLPTISALTVFTVCASVLIMLAGMQFTEVARPMFGLTMAVLCPLAITPPFSYFFLKLLHILRARERDLARANQKLEQALDQVQELSGLLPICSVCKRIRDDQGYWETLENYIMRHSKAQFTHGICPGCCQEMLDELDTEEKNPFKPALKNQA